MGILSGRVFCNDGKCAAANGLIACLLALGVVGCQSGAPTVSNRILIAHLPGVDFSGLNPMGSIERVKASCSLPSKWIPLRCQYNPLYTNQQWKSPSGYSGVGIVYAHLPFPLSAKTLLWFAKLEYSKNGEDGKALSQWTDELGRPWFEAENDMYHVRGYAVTNGFSAWIVYFGYKTNRPPSAAELNLAARCVDTVVPQSGEPMPSKPAVADAREPDSQTKG